MNLDYWEEQIKATTAIAAHLAVPVEENGFTLAATPPSRAIAPGGVATFTIGVQPTGGFTATVNLVAASPSPSLTLDLFPAAVVPPGQATLTITDTHTEMLVPSLWYTVPITATASDITQTMSVGLLVEGARVYLPIVLRERLLNGAGSFGDRRREIRVNIENREDEFNPYCHTPGDTIAHMNLDYWEEQIKATIAIAAYLAIPVIEKVRVYLTVIMKAH
jgi:hypothetical protein